MAARRRWLQFSLRGFLALLTAFAVWLGIVVHRSREQREAVKAIEALGCVVHYEWQDYEGHSLETLKPIAWRGHGSPRNWLDEIVGEDAQHKVEGVVLSSKASLRVAPGTKMVVAHYDKCFSKKEINEIIRQLKRLPALSRVVIEVSPPNTDISANDFRKALPNCGIVYVVPHLAASPLSQE